MGGPCCPASPCPWADCSPNWTRTDRRALAWRIRMSQATLIPTDGLTAADLVSQLGPTPLRRICFEPHPGTATEQHLLEVYTRTGRLCELVDGILVEKTVGFTESVLAG